jgi:hypothetical protein
MPSLTAKGYREFDFIGECPFRVEFYYSPEESATRDYPGCDDSVEIERIFVTVPTYKKRQSLSNPLWGINADVANYVDAEVEIEINIDQIDLTELEDWCLEQAGSLLGDDNGRADDEYDRRREEA